MKTFALPFLCSIALFASSLVYAAEPAQPTATLKKIEAPKALEIKTLTIDSERIKALQLSVPALEKALEDRSKQSPDKKIDQREVLATGFTIGTFKQIKSGDYDHLEIVENGKTLSFWCGRGCELLEKSASDLKDEPIKVNWREIKEWVPEAGEKITKKETLSVTFKNRKPQYYECDLTKKFPLLVEGCEGEACGILKYNKAIKSTTIFEKPALDSTKLDTLQKCELIKDFKSYTVLESLGWSTVQSTGEKFKTLGVAANDEIAIKLNNGEGYYTACIGDKEYGVSIPGGSEPSDAILKDSVQNRSVAWAKLTTPRGKTGYALDAADSFYMGYYGYDSSLLCPGDQK